MLSGNAIIGLDLIFLISKYSASLFSIHNYYFYIGPLNEEIYNSTSNHGKIFGNVMLVLPSKITTLLSLEEYI